MKIWLLQANEPMPIVNPGQRLFRTGLIAEELNKRGHEITWFATTFNHYEKKQMYNEDTEINVNDKYKIELIWAPSYKKNISVKRIINHKYMGIRFRKISKHIEKPDLIYVSFPTIDFAEEAIKYGEKNNIPVIVDIRDLWPDIFNHNIFGIKRIIAQPYIKIMNIKVKKIMKKAYAINGISDTIVDWGLEKAKRKRTNLDRYFYIGYSRKEKNTIETKNSLLNKDTFNISFFGTLGNQINYDKILQLAEKIEKEDENININICGDGPEYKKLKQKAEKLSNIKLFGWVGKDTINNVLMNSKIGMAPYNNTFDFQMGVSNKFAEYISYGLPIIMTTDGYMKSLLEKHECGFSSQDVNELFEFVISLKENKEKYKKMSKNALKLYEENFMADRIYKELIDYLENIVKEELK